MIAPNWLGDAVMALPAFADHPPSFSVRAHRGGGAAVGGADVHDGQRRRSASITLPGGGGLRALDRMARRRAARLTPGSFDTAMLFPNSFAAGARSRRRRRFRERWGYAADWRGGMLTRAIPKPHGELHQRAYYQALTTALGIAAGTAVRVDPSRWRDRRGSCCATIGLDLDEPFVVFAPGAAYGRAKQWLPERYAELADLIINERGWSVLMVGAKVDRSACDDITRRLPTTGTRINRLIDFCGKSDLPTLAGILGEAHAVVSNDSGAMHLAGAVGTKVVAVFGPTREQQTSPLSAGPDAPAAGRDYARRVLPALYASRVPDRSPLHAAHRRAPAMNEVLG